MLVENNDDMMCEGTVSSNVAYFFLVNLCYSEDDKLRIYRTNFEKAYLEATRHFYSNVASQYLEENGVEIYMNYVSIFTDHN